MKQQLKPSPRGMDFANFPLLITDLKPDPSVQLDLIEPSFLDMIARMEVELTGLIETAKQFNIQEHHLPHRVFHWIDMDQLANEQDYIAQCRSLSQEAILDLVAQGIQISLQLETRPKLGSDQIPSLLENLDRLKIDNQEKWKIISLVNDPIGKYQVYLQLLDDLVEPFQRYYQLVAPQVDSYQQAFACAIEDGFNSVQWVIDRSFRQASPLPDEPIDIYLLGINRYLLGIHQLKDRRIINMGIGLEGYLKRIIESQEHTLDARVNALRSLGDKTRYEILKSIAAGESTNKALADKLQVTSPNISYHLKTLMNDNLIMLEIKDNKSRPVINKEVVKQHLKNLATDFGLDD